MAKWAISLFVVSIILAGKETCAAESCGCKNRTATTVGLVSFESVELSHQVQEILFGFRESGKRLRIDAKVFVPSNDDFVHVYNRDVNVAFAAQLDMALATAPQALVIHTPDLALHSERLDAIPSNISVVLVGGGINLIDDNVNLFKPITHLGVNEFELGYATGSQAARLEATSALCLFENTKDTSERVRCEGFRDGFLETCHRTQTCTFDMRDLSTGNIYAFESELESVLSEANHLATSFVAVQTGYTAERTLNVLESLGRSPKVASFVVDDKASQLLASRKLLFGMDRQDYLCGFMGTTLATYASLTGQKPANRVLSSGPLLLTSPPRVPSLTVEDLRLDFIVHGRGVDGFWLDFKKGGWEAARDLGVSFEDCSDPNADCLWKSKRITYRSPSSEFDLATQSYQILEAGENLPKTNGLMISIPNLEALENAITRVISDLEAPAVSVNAGGNDAKRLGMLSHFGQEEFIAGQAAGERMAQLGGKKTVLMNHEKGNSALNQRLEGYTKGFEGFHNQSGAELVIEKSFTFGSVASFNSTAIVALLEDPEINCIMFLAAALDLSIVYSLLEQVNITRKVYIGQFDIVPGVVEDIESDRLAFAVQQQQQMQAYIPPILLAIRALTGQTLKEDWFLTGPALVEKHNAMDVLCQHELTCPVEEEYSTACPIPHAVGDGWCDALNNVDACGFDGGDCCKETCQNTAKFKCGTDRFNSGLNAFQCVDPNTREGLQRFCEDTPSDPICTGVSFREPTLINLGILLDLTDSNAADAQACNSGVWIPESQECQIGVQSRLPALLAMLAVKQFNERDGSILKEFGDLNGTCNKVFTVSVADAQSSVSGSIESVMRLLQTNHSDIILGPSTSAAALRTALLSGVFHVPQISHGATSTRLDDPESFPYFMRTILSEDEDAQTICAYWSKFGFRYAAVLFPESEDGESKRQSITKRCLQLGIQVIQFSFSPNEQDFTNVLEDLRQAQINVVKLAAHGSVAQNVLVQSFQTGLLRDGTLWVLEQDILSDTSWIDKAEATSPGFAHAMSGSITVLPEGGIDSNPVVAKLLGKWGNLTIGNSVELFPPGFLPPELSSFLKEAELRATAASIFDAVALLGLAACAVAPERAIEPETFADSLKAQIETTKFNGLSGTVQLDKNGNRSPTSLYLRVLSLMREESENGYLWKEQVLARFSSSTGVMQEIATPIFNGGNSGLISDVSIPEPEYGYDPVVDSICRVFFALNITVSLLCAAFTIWHRKHPVVRAAQVPFLLLIVLGSIISTLTIIPMTITDQGGPLAGEHGGNAAADAACMASAWLYTIGFSLTFAPLFTKMKRVKTIFFDNMRKGFKTSKRANISNAALLKVIAKVALLEITLVLIWNLVSPLKYIRQVTAVDHYGNPTQSIGRCDSDHASRFLLLIGTLHLALLVYGSYICYKTSGVNVAFSEARYVSIAMISNLQLLLVCIPVLVIVSDSPKMSVFVRSGAVFLNDLSVVLAIFVPKIYYVLHGTTSSEGVGANLISESLQKSGERNKSSVVAPEKTAIVRSSVADSSASRTGGRASMRFAEVPKTSVISSSTDY